MTNIKSNLGMYAEETINRTATFLSSRNICLIEKRELPIKIIKKVDSTTIVGKLLAKSYIDYFGVYKGKYFEFEVKQTIEEKLKLDIIKQHQFERIKFLSENNIFCFFVVYFSKYEKFYLIPGKWLLEKKEKAGSVPYEIISKECISLEVVFPGILNLVEVLDKIL